VASPTKRKRADGPARYRRDLARITFGVLVIGLLLAASLWILRPFLGPTIWAVMVVVATWPLMLRVQRLLWGGARWPWR
jgi:predicted PurR-regulated permease PerM